LDNHCGRLDVYSRIGNFGDHGAMKNTKEAAAPAVAITKIKATPKICILNARTPEIPKP
jgi:hypothetical protein